MYKTIKVYTYPDRQDLAELNKAISEGFIIEQINCDGANEYEVEADLVFYLSNPQPARISPEPAERKEYKNIDGSKPTQL